MGAAGGAVVICGIAGIYRRGTGAADEATLRAQLTTIAHRGPHHEGVLVDSDLAMGMRRLSIIDVAGSNQPIHTADGRCAIVFNGEIYNFPALRRELASLGHRFATEGDTETILAAWTEWGNRAWSRLDGMFSVAIWDHDRRELTLARDPIGIKPLYISEQGGVIAFASELKALLVVPDLDFDVDPRGVQDFFTFGHVRGPRSIYQLVRTLQPGHFLRAGPDGPITIEPYWMPAYHIEHGIGEMEWIERFRATWLETVESQMLADVELGAFLSGGVDSSAVVAAMARIANRPIKTFTIGFPDTRYDESAHAEAVARHLGCDHRTRMVELKDATDILPVIQGCYDEPFADPSAVPTWYLSQLAASEVKVALSGDGGDELFFGYKRHATERLTGQVPAQLRWAARGFAALPPLSPAMQRWQKTAWSAGLPNGAARFFAKTQISSAALRDRLFAGTPLAESGDATIARLCAEYVPDPQAISDDTLEQFAWCDLVHNLPGAMLTKIDRASMAHSLEVRVPMLGMRMIDLALAMPSSIKMRGTTGKYVIRKAIAPWLPRGTLDRRKQGFQMPLGDWFAGDFGRHVEGLWRDSGAARSNLINPPAVEMLFAEQRSGRRDHGRILYAIAMFSLWWAAERGRRKI